MSVVGRVVAGATFAALLGLHAHALYSVSLVAGGKLLGRRKRRPVQTELPRIAVVVVAHDEEKVIADSVRSLAAQEYAADRFEVFVVADHCSDRTASRARDEGATVLERSAAGGGKSEAVRFGLTHVVKRGGFDALALFDADNVVHPSFLASVGRRLASGEAVVQGYVDAKNPARTWVAKSSALGFYAIAAVAQAPREALGLSVPLMGTAWAARLDLCEEVLQGLTSLADDLEMAALLCLRGVRVAYEPEARALDEKPVQLANAVSQRHRWMQGRWGVVERYFPDLIGRALLGGGLTMAQRARTLDVAIQLVGPSLSFTAVAMGLAGATLGLAPHPVLSALGRASSRVATFYYVVPAVAMRSLRPPREVWTAYGLQPFYLLLSVPLAISGFLTRKSNDWSRTEHGEE
jgi:hypothetical protein